MRDAAVQALKACLMLVEKRETRYRVQWYYKLFEQTMRGGLSRDHKTNVMPNAGVNCEVWGWGVDRTHGKGTPELKCNSRVNGIEGAWWTRADGD